MIYYVVRQTSRATDSNIRSWGEVQTFYFGKEDTLLGWTGIDHFGTDQRPKLKTNASMVSLYGYKTAGGAKRNHSYNNPFNTEDWQSTVEIIAVEIVDGEVRTVGEVKR